MVSEEDKNDTSTNKKHSKYEKMYMKHYFIICRQQSNQL